jgi:hypothetical protein
MEKIRDFTAFGALNTYDSHLDKATFYNDGLAWNRCVNWGRDGCL